MTLATTLWRVTISVIPILIYLGAGFSAYAQSTDNVGIGTATPDNSALLELQSTTKGLLIPRMTQQERDALSQPAAGLLIYNTTTGSFQYNFGSKTAPQWVTMLWNGNNDNGSAPRIFWSLRGNDSVQANEFLGTINDAPLVLKSNNTTRMVLSPTGDVNIAGRVSIRGSLNLDSAETPLLMNGTAGFRGGVFVSSGPTLTPRWTTDLVIADTAIILDARTFVNRPIIIRDSSQFALLPTIPLTFGNLLVGSPSDIAVPLAPGINGSLLQIVAGQPQWVDPDKTEYWTLTGNSGTQPSHFLGTRDAINLRLGTNNTIRVSISAANGDVTVNSLAGAGTSVPPTPGEGLVMVDAGGRMFKRESVTLLQLPEYHIYMGDANDLASPFPPGSDSSFLATLAGVPQWIDGTRLLKERPWIIGGNIDPGFPPILGNISTAGVQDLDIYAGNRSMIFLNGAVPGVSVRAPLNLEGNTTPLTLNGDAGSAGMVLISRGAGFTPAYTDSIGLRSLTVSQSLIVNGRSTFNDTAQFNVFPKIPLQYGNLLSGSPDNWAAPLAPGINGSLLQIVAGQPQWIDPDKTEYWTLSGNTGVAPSAYVGTRDGNDLRLGTNNTFRVTISGANGEITASSLSGAGTTAPLTPGEGVVVADPGGRLVKRDIGAILRLPQNNLFVGDANDVATPFAPGADSTFLGIFNGTPTWYNLGTVLNARAWTVGGNVNPPSEIIGNLTNGLDIRAGGQTRLYLQGASEAVDVRASLNLDGTNRELRLNGNPGADGFVLVSWGPGRTPYYTDSLVLRKLRVTDSLIVDAKFDLPLTNAHMFVGNASNKATELAPGINGSLLQVVGGQPTWVEPDKSEFWTLSGNTGVAPSAFVGTRDGNDLRLGTNNTFRMSISGTNGEVTVNTLSGPGIVSPPTLGEGFVIADNGGRLIKRDLSSLLQLPHNYIYVGDSNNIAQAFAPGADSTFLGIFNGTPTWYNLASVLNSRAWTVGGNTNPPSEIIGNLTNGLDVRAGGQTRLYLQGASEAVDVRASLNLDGTNRELRLNGNPGTDGFVLVSWGPGRTPYYTDSLVLRKLRVTDSLIVDAKFDLPLTNAHMFVGNASNKATELAPGINGSLLQVVGGQPTWVEPDKSEFWTLSGNTGVAPSAFVGTRDGNDLRLGTNNTFRMSISGTNGEVTVNTLSGPGIVSPPTLGEGFVIADNGGRLIKRDLSSLLQLPHNYIYVGDSNNIAQAFAPGADSTFLGIFNGTPTWYNLASVLNSRAWTVGGNTNPPSEIIGNLTNGLDVRAGGQTRLYLQGASEAVDVRASLNLDGTNRELRLNGNPGTDGFVLVSWGPGKTPYYTDSLVLRKLRVTDSLQIDGNIKLPLNRGNIYVGDNSNFATQLPPGVEGSLLQIVAGTPEWLDPSLSGFWSLQGNQGIPPTAFLGTRDANDLRINTDNQLRLTISATGSVTINSLSGATVTGPLAPSEGFVSADATGRLVKRDLSTILSLPQHHLYVGDATNTASPFAPGADSTFLAIIGGTPTWFNLSGLLRDKAWIQGGNDNVVSPIIGNLQTSGITDLDIRAGGQTRLYLQGASEAIDVRASLNLDGTNRELRLNGNPGTDGFVLVSWGPGRTPYYTDSLVLRKLRVTDSLQIDGNIKLPLNRGNIYVGDNTNFATQLPPGPDSTVLLIQGGTPVWSDINALIDGKAWVMGGNTTVPNPILGNMQSAGNRDLDIRAGGTTRMYLDAAASRIDARNAFNLDGTDVPLLLNGSAGTDGFVLVTRGPGLTPYYTDSLVLRKLRVTDSLKLPLNYAHIYVGDLSNSASQLAPGINGSVLQISAGQPSWVQPEDAAFWSLTGNNGVGATAFVGTRDAYDLRLATNGTTRVTVAQGSGSVTMTSLSGAPSSAPIGVNDGIVVADATGMLEKKDRSIILGMLGIYGGRYTNTGGVPEFTVVVTLPIGATLDPQASITLTPEASTSVSATPFIINGSRTASTFSISFPGGLNPGEAINWLVRNP